MFFYIFKNLVELVSRAYVGFIPWAFAKIGESGKHQSYAGKNFPQFVYHVGVTRQVPRSIKKIATPKKVHDSKNKSQESNSSYDQIYNPPGWESYA
jgi:hypothetical protein